MAALTGGAASLFIASFAMPGGGIATCSAAECRFARSALAVWVGHPTRDAPRHGLGHDVLMSRLVRIGSGRVTHLRADGTGPVLEGRARCELTREGDFDPYLRKDRSTVSP